MVLDSSTMPPSPQQTYTPSAQTSTPDGEGPKLNVLLSDDTITQVLGTANTAADSKAAAFSVAQRYLAETAMIAAERPELPRSIVVAPPRHWDPPGGPGQRAALGHDIGAVAAAGQPEPACRHPEPAGAGAPAGPACGQPRCAAQCRC